VTDGVLARVVERIHRGGPIPFDAFVDEALYGEGGFFAGGRGAGRAGRDFVTSPEVGSLFGALVAVAIDREWEALGRPDPFLVVDAGAGRGRLAADVLRAAPACERAMHYVLVERSAELRTAQRDLVTLEPIEDALGPAVRMDEEAGLIPVTGLGPIATSLPELPTVSLPGVIVANELLDNLPFRVVERTAAGWDEIRVTAEGTRLAEAKVRASDELSAEAEVVAAGDVPVGARLPVPVRLGPWLRACAATLRRGALVVIDYAAAGTELAARGADGWLRTYRAHERGGSPLDDPGGQDVTADVPVEHLVHSAARAGFTLVEEVSQADWLRGLGLDALVDEARAGWDARAHVGDLDALRHRSRVSEAAALTDPSGLGAHRVFVFRRDPTG